VIIDEKANVLKNPLILNKEMVEYMPNCKLCGTKMIRRTLDLSRLAGIEGVEHLDVDIWICPKTKTTAKPYPLVFYYCSGSHSP